MGDFSTVFSVVHHQQFQLLGVVDKELVETVGKKISGGLVRAITDLRLRDGTLESSSDARVNTLLLSPRGTTNAPELLVLMSLEGLGSLLEDLLLVDGGNVDHFSGIYKQIGRAHV